MGDDLGVGIGAELRAIVLELLAQLAEILDDSIVHHREAVGGMRMRVALGRTAMGRPAGVADADRAVERLALEPAFEVAQLALGAAAGQVTALERGHACRVIAAIFEALERIDELHRHRLAAEYADNPAHGSGCLLAGVALMLPRQPCMRSERASQSQNRCHPVTRGGDNQGEGRRTSYSAAGVFLVPAALTARRRAARFSLTTCRLRAIARASGGTSWVTTEPVAT